MRGADSEFYTNLNNYLSKDIKDYLQSAIKPFPKNGFIIWGTNAAIGAMQGDAIRNITGSLADAFGKCSRFQEVKHFGKTEQKREFYERVLYVT